MSPFLEHVLRALWGAAWPPVAYGLGAWALWQAYRVLDDLSRAGDAWRVGPDTLRRLRAGDENGRGRLT